VSKYVPFRVKKPKFKILKFGLAFLISELARIFYLKKGTRMVDPEGFAYFKYSEKAGSHISWRCSKYRNGCKVRVNTIGNWIVAKYEEHNHHSDPNYAFDEYGPM
jgi:hypothetical protein